MERLTRRSDTGHAYYPRCFEEPCNRRCEDCLFDETICERLAAYEDSECEPEEVLPKDKADEIAMKLMRLADLESLCSYARLRELAEADKDGRVAVLPVKPVLTPIISSMLFIIEDGDIYEDALYEAVAGMSEMGNECSLHDAFLPDNLRTSRHWQDRIPDPRGSGASVGGDEEGGN